MKVTLLGHASVLVEMDGAVCLMDPVFFDPFEEGAVVSCPKRVVHTEWLPPVDTLIISHRHPDHFDLVSLARVPRDCDVIIPADPLLAYALQKLGFERIHPVHPMGPILSERFELYPTESEVRTVREFGMVFKDSSGTFWNQVDSFLSAETIEAIKDRFGGVDLLFAMYAGQNFEYFDGQSTSFPHETHRRNLENVIRVDPRMIAPGAAGFRFCADHAWLNSFVFPISRERFVTDLKRLGFPGAIEIMNPGDVFELGREGVSHRPGASDVARLVEDDSALIRFDPTAPVPELIDPNPDGYSRETLTRVTDSFVTDGIGHYARKGYRHDDDVVSLYRRHLARYAIAVVFPDGAASWYRFEFDAESVRLLSGPKAAGAADMAHRIAASALVGWIPHTKSFFYVRAYSRRYGTPYALSLEGRQVRLERHPLPDLLMHYLLNVMEGSEFAAKRQVDIELQTLLSGPASRLG
ncbi:MAG: MBL fold metallo-hydrolase [Kiloniellaceae bacterium]